jgi:hypothetical protein
MDETWIIRIKWGIETKSKSVKSNASWKFKKFAKNPINRPFMAMFKGFKLSKSIHTPKREGDFKNLGKSSIREVRKRKSDSFAKFAKESDECRKSISRSHKSVANGILSVARTKLNVAGNLWMSQLTPWVSQGLVNVAISILSVARTELSVANAYSPDLRKLRTWDPPFAKFAKEGGLNGDVHKHKGAKWPSCELEGWHLRSSQVQG